MPKLVSWEAKVNSMLFRLTSAQTKLDKLIAERDNLYKALWELHKEGAAQGRSGAHMLLLKGALKGENAEECKSERV